MDTDRILELYDRWERRESVQPGFTRVEGPATVRMVDDSGGCGCLLWSDLDGRDADAAIAGELGFFAGRGQGFEWKTFSHDRPADLADRLGRAGFKPGELESVMALELAETPDLPGTVPGIEIRRIVDPDDIRDLGVVDGAVWDEDGAAYAEQVARQMRACPGYMSVYVAYADGVPVSASRVILPQGSPFASLWGGSTLPAFRNRGIYTAMLAARIAEAAARGYAFITIDAGPMSRPVVEKRGFRLLAESRPFLSP